MSRPNHEDSSVRGIAAPARPPLRVHTPPGVTPPPLTAPAETPLSSAERLRADRAARRLHAEARSLIAALEPEHRSAAGLARALDLDRTSCQRLVSAVRGPYPGPEIVESLPGARALRAIIQEIKERALAPAERLDGADAAVERFDQTIASLAGSRAKLLQRLEASDPRAISAPASTAEGDDLAHRRTLFESAAALTGRWSEAWVASYLYHPDPRDSDRLLTHRAFGLLGHRAAPEAVPLVIHNFSSTDTDAPAPGIFRADGEPSSHPTAPAVLEAFTSAPIPLVSTANPREFLVQSIDLDEEEPDASIDLMMAATGSVPHPRTRDNQIEELWALVNFPARRLLLDAWLPRDESRASIPSLAAHLWGPDFATDESRRWQTRFARSPVLQLLGAGLSSVRADANPRHEELTRALFDSAGRRAEDYVGVRCAIDYPIWRAGYCITFDFAESE